MIGRLKQWLRGADVGQDTAAAAALDDRDATRVLMVCSGNICRSPTAEGVLRAKLRLAGLQHRVQVDSAGTHGFHLSEPPDARAIRLAALRGYDISGLRARPVGSADFARFDWLIAMDRENLAWLKKCAPAGHAVRMTLLMSHASKHPQVHEVPDPYYGTEAGFERVLDLLEDACDGLVAQWQDAASTDAAHRPAATDR